MDEQELISLYQRLLDSMRKEGRGFSGGVWPLDDVNGELWIPTTQTKRAAIWTLAKGWIKKAGLEGRLAYMRTETVTVTTKGGDVNIGFAVIGPMEV